jgi:N-acetylglucosamine-6-sulfatase
MKRKLMTLAVSGVLALTASAASAAEKPSAATVQAKKKPNIVFVLTDDLAWNLVKYMPNVQRMEQNGTTFSNYFVTDSLCCPSRSTTFTGKLPHNTGVFTNSGNDGGYDTFNAHGNQNNTFATALSGAGYRTAMMGKYLNGYQPKDPIPPGWNEWDVTGNGYPEFNYKLNENGHIKKYGHKPSAYLTDVLNRKAINFINQSAKNGKPFMMEVATFAPHGDPKNGLAVPAPRDAKKFPHLKAPRGPAFNESNISDKPAWLKNHKKLTAKQIKQDNAKYRKRVQAVQAVDRMIGNLQTALKANGTARDTYVVFTSDNGFHLGEHRLVAGKMTAFDTDINVPLIITGPGVAAGKRTDRLAQNTDLCPTFEHLGGAPVPSSVDGVPLLNAKAPKRDAVLIEHHGPDRNTSDPDFQANESGNPPSYEAIRTKDAVYVEYADGEREYYNLRRDPNELTNTYGKLSAAHRNKLATILHALKKCSGKDCRR